MVYLVVTCGFFSRHVLIFLVVIGFFNLHVEGHRSERRRLGPNASIRLLLV
jgi:hypothetical protein